jgi:aryl-alcohol dehydrogenase-like predicted oxidoreductase
MTFGEDWGWGASKEESRRIFDAFAEAGGNFIDTSVNYTNGTSESFVGEFVKGEREHFVVATKYSLTRPDQTDPNQSGNSRKNMMHSVERSLKRLQTDYIDLLYLHMWDHMTPVEEVMRGLDDLVRQGKVLYVGISDTPAWVVAEANTLAELRGWSRFVALQVPYSLADRAIERAEMPMAKRWDMAVMAWGMLEGGVLTGKYTAHDTGPKRYNLQSLDRRTRRIVRALQEVADRVGRTPSQVAINWVRQQQHQAQVIPILGARTLAQVQDNLACVEWTLPTRQLRRLSRIAAIEYGFPRDFLEGGARQFIFGATFDQIDNHRGNPAR